MKSASSGACCWQSKGLFFLMQINFCFDACGDIFFDIHFLILHPCAEGKPVLTNHLFAVLLLVNKIG